MNQGDSIETCFHVSFHILKLDKNSSDQSTKIPCGDKLHILGVICTKLRTIF